MLQSVRSPTLILPSFPSGTFTNEKGPRPLSKSVERWQESLLVRATSRHTIYTHVFDETKRLWLTRRVCLFSFCLEAGLSGGQRKLLLFELISQRTSSHADLLLVLDEPFAGVTDDFVPFIVDRLNLLRKQHNILLVTNDHVETLKELADNTIIVSAIDRSTVQVNGMDKVNRDKAILALSVGDEFTYEASLADLKFFFDVEVANNGALLGIAAFTVVVFGLFLVSFWDSDPDSAALVIVAGSIIAFFCINPYLLALVDWRNFVSEEAEALLHASKSMNKALKSLLTLLILIVVSLIEWGMVNAVVDGFAGFQFWVAILMDSASLTFPFIFFGLYTKLPFQAVEIFAIMPFLLMIFFSTTFSPGSGVAGLKELRYLFPRFYFWCIVPGVQDDMEGCPADDVNMLYLILSAMIGLVLFLIYQTSKTLTKASKKKDAISKQSLLKDEEFRDLQVELYGEGVLLKDSLAGTSHSLRSGA
jgi:hypothetical protein